MATVYLVKALILGIWPFIVTHVRRIVLGPRRPLEIPGEPFAWQDIEARGDETDSGYIEAKNIVVAAGAWTRRLLEPIGIDPVLILRRGRSLL
jgi:glycine/D-amino acid oxidase-like deaminating enzyme